MRIKVEVSKLIAHLVKQDVEADKKYEKTLAQYEKESASYAARLADAISKLASDVRTGKMTPDMFDKIVNGGCREGWRARFGIPDRPDKPTKPGKNKTLIERLKMSSEPTLNLDADEFRTFGL